MFSTEIKKLISEDLYSVQTTHKCNGELYVKFFMLKTLKLLNFSYARAGKQHRMTINQLVSNSEVNNSDINKILWDFSLLNSLICSMCGFGREILWKNFLDSLTTPRWFPLHPSDDLCMFSDSQFTGKSFFVPLSNLFRQLKTFFFICWKKSLDINACRVLEELQCRLWAASDDKDSYLIFVHPPIHPRQGWELKNMMTWIFYDEK